MAVTDETLQLGMKELVWQYTRNITTNPAWSLDYMSTIINMATAKIFQVIPNKFHVIRISASGNYAEK
jgi:hypothetical protein